MKNNAKTGLMLGRLTPHQDGPAGMILKPVRDEIIDGLNSFRNPKFLVKFMGDDGVSTITKECDVVMTPRGYSVMIDLNEIVGGGGAGTATVQQFKIQDDGGDYWNCKTWDGTTLGSTVVKVAKPYKLRASTGAITSETIRGVTYTYSYTGVYISGSSGPFKYYTRSVSGSDGSSETDYMIPDPQTNDIIYGISFSTTTPSTLSAVTWLDINVDGRAWTS